MSKRSVTFYKVILCIILLGYSTNYCKKPPIKAPQTNMPSLKVLAPYQKGCFQSPMGTVQTSYVTLQDPTDCRKQAHMGDMYLDVNRMSNNCERQSMKLVGVTNIAYL